MNASPEVNSTGLPVLTHAPSWTSELVLRAATLVVLMLLTVSGNVTILVVLTCSRYRKLNSRVNIFIVNLAVGDLTVVCFTMTSELLFVVSEKTWILGNVACKLILYVQIVTLASTTFILTAMSIDRYMAICKPLTLSSLTLRPGRMVAVSWLLAFLLASPQLFIFKQEAVGVYPNGEVKYRCASKGYTAWWQRKTYFTFLASYILVIPTIVISFCYMNVVLVVWRRGRESSERSGGVALRRTIRDKASIPRAKMKTIKMTLSIILTFIVCWSPYFAVHLIHIWTEYRYEIPKSLYAFAETIAFVNSGLNPIIYGCFNIRPRRTRRRRIDSETHALSHVKQTHRRLPSSAAASSRCSRATLVPDEPNRASMMGGPHQRTPLAGNLSFSNGSRGGYGLRDRVNRRTSARGGHGLRGRGGGGGGPRCFRLRVLFRRDGSNLGRDKVSLSELVAVEPRDDFKPQNA